MASLDRAANCSRGQPDSDCVFARCFLARPIDRFYREFSFMRFIRLLTLAVILGFAALAASATSPAQSAPIAASSLAAQVAVTSPIEKTRLYCFNRYTGQFLHWGRAAATAPVTTAGPIIIVGRIVLIITIIGLVGITTTHIIERDETLLRLKRSGAKLLSRRGCATFAALPSRQSIGQKQGGTL